MFIHGNVIVTCGNVILQVQYHEKGQYFCYSFQKVKPIYYIDPLHIAWNISSLYFLKCWWLWLTDNENPIYIRLTKKKDTLNRNVRLLKSMFISMHSILGWPSFCMNYSINAAWHGGNQPVALLKCNGSTGCFDSGLSDRTGTSFHSAFRSGLVALFLKMSESGDSWCTDSLLVKLSQMFESALLDSILFLPNLFSFQSTLHLICFDTALCEQPSFQ